MNTKQCIDEFKSVHGDRYEYSKVEYVNRKTKVIIVCREHGEFMQYSGHHANGSGCPKCAGNKKLSLLEFLSEANKVHGDKYNYSKITKLDGVMTPVEIVCKDHGSFWQTPSMHKQGQGCPACSNKKPLTTEEAIERIKNGIGDNYTFDNFNYTTKKDKVTVTCKDHGDFVTSVELAELGYGCPECGGRKGKMTTAFFIQCARLTHGDKYNYSNSKFVNSYTPVKIECSIHGEFEQLHHNHIKGTGCPMCHPKVSKVEESLAKDLQGYLPVRVSGLIRGKQELDICFPSRNIAVEVNGVYYHHAGRKNVDFHLQKTEDCLSIGIQLMHFWDYEIIEKKPIVLSMIKSKLNDVEHIMARKTVVRLLTTAEATKFVNENHISGNTPATVYYGLTSHDELVAVCSFGKSRFNKNYEWEILRYCSKLNTRVIGGFSKLFKHFISDNNPSSVITYADRRFGEGEVYKKCGFTFLHNSKPNYSWVSNNGAILKRYQTQKHKLQNILMDRFDPTKSESENMVAAKYMQVYDCGNKVFVWQNKDHPKVV